MAETVVDGGKQTVVDMAGEDDGCIARTVVVGKMLLDVEEVEPEGVVGNGVASQWVVGTK